MNVSNEREVNKMDIQIAKGLTREEYVKLLNTVIKTMEAEGIEIQAGPGVCSGDVLNEAFEDLDSEIVRIW